VCNNSDKQSNKNTVDDAKVEEGIGHSKDAASNTGCDYCQTSLENT